MDRERSAGTTGEGVEALVHDLNNMFAAIKAHIMLIGDATSDDAVIEGHLDRMRRATRRAEELAGELSVRARAVPAEGEGVPR